MTGHPNDMVVDRLGRAFVGNFALLALRVDVPYVGLP